MTTERKPHPHADVIKAWADGYEIQFRYSPTGSWEDVTVKTPGWSEVTEYRIKPEPKKPTTWYQVVIKSVFGGRTTVEIKNRLFPSREDAEKYFVNYEVLHLIPIHTEDGE